MCSERSLPQLGAVMACVNTDESIRHLGTVLREGFKEIRLDDRSLVLHGLVQAYAEVEESRKMPLLLELLQLPYTQAVVFTSGT